MGKYKIKKGLITQKSEGITTIFDGEKSVLYRLNFTASFIFAQIKKGLSEKQIANLISEKYSISEIKAKNDTEEYIKDLKLKKIIS